MVSYQGRCDTSQSLFPNAGLFLRDLGLLLMFSKVLCTHIPLCVSSVFPAHVGQALEEKGPRANTQLSGEPTPQEVGEADRFKKNWWKQLDSLVDLREGHVFLSGREPWCRNRLKPGKRAAAVAEAVYLNLFAVWPSGPAAKFTYKLFSMFLHLER